MLLVHVSHVIEAHGLHAVLQTFVLPAGQTVLSIKEHTQEGALTGCVLITTSGKVSATLDP